MRLMSTLTKAAKAATTIATIFGAADALAPTVEATKGVINEHHTKHANDAKIPKLTELSLDDAHEILTNYPVKSINILVAPNKRFAHKRPNTVLRTEPRTGSVVSPDTFFKLFYVDEATILESKELLKLADEQKSKKKEARKELTHKLVNSSKAEAGTLSHKLSSTLHHVTHHTKKGI